MGNQSRDSNESSSDSKLKCPFCHRPLGTGKEKEKHLFEIKKLKDKLDWDRKAPQFVINKKGKVLMFFYDPHKKLRKKLKKISDRYNAAKGKPVLRARLLKMGVSIEKKLRGGYYGF